MELDGLFHLSSSVGCNFILCYATVASCVRDLRIRVASECYTYQLRQNELLYTKLNQCGQKANMLSLLCTTPVVPSVRSNGVRDERLRLSVSMIFKISRKSDLDLVSTKNL